MLATTIILALREIRRHLLRSFLTMLGIVIGVAAVITMVTLGNGATAAVTSQISSLGSNLLRVTPGQAFRGGGRGERPRTFKIEDVDAIREQVAGIAAVTGQVQAGGSAVRNGQNWTTTITGTTNDYLVAQDWAILKGRPFAPAEEVAGKSVCIIGQTIVHKLFEEVDPVGQSFRIKGISCDVIGVLKGRGQGGFGSDQDDVVIMPIRTVQRRISGNRELGAILISVDPNYETEAVKASLTSLLRERRGPGGKTDDDFSVLDTKQISEAVAGSTRILTALLGSVAAVSLVVGGIGIMNIMLVSVTERTREIGIRLAIGALSHEVLRQFLVEAVTLACLGGVIGILLAFGLTAGLSVAMSIPFMFDPQTNVLSFVFSAIIGVVFGYFPARRAAALNPIEALRHE